MERKIYCNVIDSQGNELSGCSISLSDDFIPYSVLVDAMNIIFASSHTFNSIK